MNQIISKITKFGSYIIFANLSLLTILIFLKRFGVAEKFGNFFLLISILLVILQMIKVKARQGKPVKRSSFLFLCWLGVIVMIVFWPIFSPGPVAWGDSPYYYPEAFKEPLAEPLVWESRGRLGIVNDLYWIYPLMLIYNFLGSFLGNDLTIRIVFYLPTLLFAILGPWSFARYFGFSPIVGLFASVVYAINTYIILIIDGGQVGVALAYGLFPLTLLNLHKLASKKTMKQFYTSLLFFMLTLMADVRIGLVAFFTFILWSFIKYISKREFDYRAIKLFLFFVAVTLGLSAYWLIPAFILEPTTGFGLRSDLKLISVLNPLFLYSPHWPFNEFGKVFPPSLYFAPVPLLIFLSLVFKRNWYVLIFTLSFLIFVFIAKGESGFLGNVYSFLIDNIPSGGAFRDSTKFFAPILLYAGILIGMGIDNLQQLFKRKLFSRLIILITFIYLVSLMQPAIFGSLQGVLAGRNFPTDLQVIASSISKESGFKRTLWFPERNTLSYHTEDSPALDAKTLVNLRPIASLNVGISDRFNFLHNPQYLEWLDIFGIKYLIFMGDTRRVLPNEEIDRDWAKLLNLIQGSKGLERVDLGSFPVYQTKHNKPRIFTVDKMLVVLGGDDIYQKLIDENQNFSLGDQGFVFLEDGKFNPRELSSASSESAILVFNQKEKLDLQMSFLSEFFLSPFKNKTSQWGLISTGDYLNWKFELLVNQVGTKEYDYGKGIAFSSQPKEEISFNINIPASGEYFLAIRHLAASNSLPLNLTFADYKDEITKKPGKFSWYTKELNLSEGAHNLVIENSTGFQVVNVVAVIPKKNWEEAKLLAEDLTHKFMVVDLTVESFNPESRWHEVNYKMLRSVEYELSIPKQTNWLIFSDTYHPSWILEKETFYEQSKPVYSAINSFYIGDGFRQGKLVFKEQDKIPVGINISVTTLVALIAILLRYVLLKLKLKVL